MIDDVLLCLFAASGFSETVSSDNIKNNNSPGREELIGSETRADLMSVKVNRLVLLAGGLSPQAFIVKD